MPVRQSLWSAWQSYRQAPSLIPLLGAGVAVRVWTILSCCPNSVLSSFSHMCAGQPCLQASPIVKLLMS